MSNDKIIISASPPIHRLVAQMPEFNRRYGLWIINASFAVRSAPDGFARCPERKFEFYSISHLIEGGGRLWIEQQDEQELTPGTLVVITPGIRNRYGGNGLPYVEDSIRFCGPVADMMAASGILVSGAYELGTVRRLCPIIEQIADPSRDAQIHANIQLQNLLTELYFSNRERSRSSQMEELLQLIQNDLQQGSICAKQDQQDDILHLGPFHGSASYSAARGPLGGDGLSPLVKIEQLQLLPPAIQLF